jgi:choline monooxygenase
MYAVDADITRASTLDPRFYRDAAAHERVLERIFARSWQWAGALDGVKVPGALLPLTLLPGSLEEPLLLARDDTGHLRCLSNVCTHRGNLLVREACVAREIRCGYHSRRFDLAGRMTFMPEFREARGFPSSADDLPCVAFSEWGGHGFASLDPLAPFEAFFDDARASVEDVPLEAMAHDPSRDREFVIDAHWALYVENYLEGFHIPFVHPALGGAVDYGTYETRLHRYANVQLARDKSGGIAARYWWIFPNLMLNFYPWGLSLNLVLPEGLARTRVLFRSFVADASQLERGAGADLDRVEAEDEAIVLGVQRGVRSRLYRGGRYSPTRERGVHHFHRLLCENLEPLR